MLKTGLTAHCVVRNEERWVWYAINSVLSYVERIFVYDTGSTDKTVDIIQKIKSKKIIFEQKGVVDKNGFTKLRQEMLERTRSDWFLILDGDEVWTQAAMQELTVKIQKASAHQFIVLCGFWACCGDVFHFAPEVERIHNHIDLPVGYKAVRAVRRTISGLHAVGKYGVEGYRGEDNLEFGQYPLKKMIILKEKYFHMTFLPRSGSRVLDREVMLRGLKTRFYRGKAFPKTIKYPEVFYQPRPRIVPSPWRCFTRFDELRGLYYRGQNFIERISVNEKSETRRD